MRLLLFIKLRGFQKTKGFVMKNHLIISRIVLILLIIGGLNWGLVGLFGWDVIASIFGYMSVLSRIIYVLVGIAAVYRTIVWLRAKSK